MVFFNDGFFENKTFSTSIIGDSFVGATLSIHSVENKKPLSAKVSKFVIDSKGNFPDFKTG